MSTAIRRLGFLTPGNFRDDDPFDGLERTLQLFELGERLGYDSAWVRQRHLEHGVSSAGIFLAAATQRTSHIELGSAVIQIGYESPWRLAEDLSTVDVLSRGRLNIGLSAGVPLHADLLGPLVFDGNWRDHDMSHERVIRFANNLRSEFLGATDSYIDVPGGRVRPRLQPHAKGLIDRLWYGGGSLRSAGWAGRSGFNLLLSNVTSGEDTDDFSTAQLRQIAAYREASDQPRIALGRVVVPFDSADARTRAKYERYAAGRHDRTLRPNGERRTLFAGDIVGTSQQILDTLLEDPVLAEVEELRLELPYEFEQHEYEQIIGDFITHIASEIGWQRESSPSHGTTTLRVVS